MKTCCFILVILCFLTLTAQQITYQPFHEGTTMWLHEEIKYYTFRIPKAIGMRDYRSFYSLTKIGISLNKLHVK